jgi:KAP family P-loop domain
LEAEVEATPIDARQSAETTPVTSSPAVDAPIAGVGDGGSVAAIRVRRNNWFGLAALTILAGVWGLIGGWYLGLPLGGEIRSDPFAENTENFGPWLGEVLLRTIPHPALAHVAIIPRLADVRYSPRAAARFLWLPDNLQPQTPPAKRAANDRPLRLAANGPFVLAQSAQELQPPPPLPPETPAPPQQQQPPPIPPQQQQSAPQLPANQPQWPSFRTNLRAASRVVIGPLGSNAVFCLAINLPVSCLKIPTDAPEGTPIFMDRTHFVATPVRALIVLDQNGDLVPKSLSAALDAVGFVQTEFVATGPTPISSLAVGSESDAPSAGSVFWIGSYQGAVYKVALRDGGTVSVTASHAPTSAMIDFVFFVSATDGWAFTLVEDSGERNTNRPAVMQTSDGAKTWQRLPYRWLPAPWVFAAFMVGLGAFARGTRVQMQLRPVAVQKYITDHGVSDNPIGLDDADAIGLSPIAAALSRFVRNVETKPTVAVAVTGPWGSGKTSLMNLVYEDLSDRGVSTVWFNAWHNQKEENLLAALLAAIRSEAVGPIWTLQGLNYRMRVGTQRILKDPGRSAALGILFAIGIFLLWHFYSDALAALNRLANFFTNLRSSQSAASPVQQQNVGKTLADLTLTTGGLTTLFIAAKKIFDLFQPLKALPAELLARANVAAGTKDIDAQLSFRYRFSKEFATFCEVLRWPPYPGLVIFVDDLDRCEPRQTVDVLEAINFVTNAGQCFVILGFDESRVKAAIADTYKNIMLQLDNLKNDDGKPTHDELGAFASRYLEKLVHLVVPVPRSQRQTVEKLLGITPLPPVSAKERRRRRWRRTMIDFVATLVLGAVLLSATWFVVDVMTGIASTTPNPVENANAPSSPIASTQQSGAAGGTSASGTAAGIGASSAATPPTTFLSNDQIGNLGLRAGNSFSFFAPSLLVAGFVLIIGGLGLRYLPRLNYAEAIVTDSDRFRDAVSIWVPVIAERRETPRDVKRFVNRLRFLAMRVRDLGPQGANAVASSLDESKLVSFAAIEDLSIEGLGETFDGPDILQLPLRVKSLIMDGLKGYTTKFHRPLYDDPQALAVYRTVAGLVEESGSSKTEAV